MDKTSFTHAGFSLQTLYSSAKPHLKRLSTCPDFADGPGSNLDVPQSLAAFA
jgi:hypothetical protein